MTDSLQERLLEDFRAKFMNDVGETVRITNDTFCRYGDLEPSIAYVEGARRLITIAMVMLDTCMDEQDESTRKMFQESLRKYTNDGLDWAFREDRGNTTGGP